MLCGAYWLFVLGVLYFLGDLLQFIGNILLEVGILLQYGIHLLTILPFLRRFDGLRIVILYILYLLIIRIEASDHTSHRLDLLDKSFIDLLLLFSHLIPPIFLVQILL